MSHLSASILQNTLSDDMTQLIFQFLDTQSILNLARTCKRMEQSSKCVILSTVYRDIIYIGQQIMIKRIYSNTWGVGFVINIDKTYPKQIQIYILHDNFKVWIDLSLDYELEWNWCKNYKRICY